MPGSHRDNRTQWSQQWFRHLVEQSADIVFVLSSEGIVHYANAAVNRILGLDQADLIGDDIDQILHSDDRDEFTDSIEAIRRDPDDTQRTEIRLKKAGGSQYWVESIFTSPATDVLDGIVVTARPIADRQQRREKLTATEERRELALEGANIGIWDWNMRTGEVQRDELLTRMLGYTPAEMGDHLDDWERLVHPDGKKRHDDALAEHVENRTPYYQCEYRLQTDSGDWKWVRTVGKVVERDEDGTPVRAVGIHLDIDDRKRAKLALQAERDLFREGPAVVFEWKDQAGWPIEYVSENVAELLGYTQTELQANNRRFADLVHEDDLDRLQQGRGEQTDSGQTRFNPEPYRVVTADGDVRWVIEHTQTLQEDGTEGGLLGYLVDITERKQSEERYRNLFEDTRDALMIFDRDGYIDCNEQALELFKIDSPEGCLGLKPWELAPSEQPDGRDSKEVALEHITTAFEEGEAFFEFTHQQVDGTEFPAEVKLSRFEHRGQPMLHGLVRDITERKERERELREREAKYRNLFEDTRDALMLLNRDGFFDCNERTLDLFGVESVDDFVEFAPWDLSPETQPDGTDSKRAATEHIETAFQEGEEFFEWTHQRSDGTEFPAEVKLSRFYLNGDPALHALVRDITERKAYQQELKALATRFQFALEETDTGVWDWDPETDELVWDEESERLLGYEPGGVPGTFEGFADRIHDADVSAVRDEIRNALQTGDDLKTEFRVQTPQNESRWIQTRGAVQYDDTGEPERIVGIQTDITDRKQREEKIRWERELNRRMQTVLADARTRQKLEDRVTEQLYQHGYALAWIGQQIEHEVVPRAVGGGRRYVDNIDRAIDTTDAPVDPSVLAAQTGDAQFYRDVENQSSNSWTDTAGKYNYRSCAAVPLVYQDIPYGILAVYHEQPNRFEESERQLLTELGDTIAFAIHSLETQDSLADDRMMEATVRMTDGHYIAELSQRSALRQCDDVVVNGTVPVDEDIVMQYLEFDCESTSAVRDILEDSPAVRDTSVVFDEETTRLQVRVADPVPETHLASRGIIVSSTLIGDDAARIQIELPSESDIGSIATGLRDAFGSGSVQSISERDRTPSKIGKPFGTGSDLTAKQLTALKAAYHNGYFERPRHTTATEIAESLGVTHSTFLQHLHRAQQKVFRAQFQ